MYNGQQFTAQREQKQQMGYQHHSTCGLYELSGQNKCDQHTVQKCLILKLIILELQLVWVSLLPAEEQLLSSLCGSFPLISRKTHTSHPSHPPPQHKRKKQIARWWISENCISLLCQWSRSRCLMLLSLQLHKYKICCLKPDFNMSFITK